MVATVATSPSDPGKCCFQFLHFRATCCSHCVATPPALLQLLLYCPTPPSPYSNSLMRDDNQQFFRALVTSAGSGSSQGTLTPRKWKSILKNAQFINPKNQTNKAVCNLDKSGERLRSRCRGQPLESRRFKSNETHLTNKIPLFKCLMSCHNLMIP